MDEIASIVVNISDRLTLSFRLQGIDMARRISISLLFLCTTFVTGAQEPPCRNEAPAIRPDQAQSISQIPLLLSGRASSDDGRPLDDSQGVGNVVETTASLTTLAAPEKARRAYEQAVREARKKNGRLEKATAQLEKATRLYPEFAAAWGLLGQLRLELEDEDGARKALELAVAIDPKYIQPHVVMMELEAGRQKWEETSNWSTRVLELNQHLAEAHYYHGISNLNLGQAGLAEESLREVRASPRAAEFPYASYMLGFLLAHKGDFDAASLELQSFLEISPEGPEAEGVRLELAKWEKASRIKLAKRD